MEEYSYVGIANADNVQIMIQELEERNAKLKEQLAEIKRLREQIERKKDEIRNMSISVEKDFVELGNMLPKVKVERKEKKIVARPIEEKVERREIDLEKLREEFERLKREFSQF